MAESTDEEVAIADSAARARGAHVRAFALPWWSTPRAITELADASAAMLRPPPPPRVANMPKPGRQGRRAAKEETPAGLLKEAEAAIETGERRQRAGELDKAAPYFSTALATLERGGLVDDRQGCLLFASATSSRWRCGRRSAASRRLTSRSRRASSAPTPTPSSLRQRAHALRGAAEALERGHAAAEAAGAGAEELGHFCVARAQAAEMLREALSDAPAARRRCARRSRGRRRRQTCGARRPSTSRIASSSPSPIRRRCPRTPARCSRVRRARAPPRAGG